ncbi:MAG TPA: PspC domain-containing protein [Jiangellaceae bacterium]
MSTDYSPTTRRGLVRPRDGRIIGGVAAGLAQRFGWTPTGVRVAFLVSCILPGPQFVIYLALWLIMPSED